MSHSEHRAASQAHHATCIVITCSDTRTMDTDTSGALICKLLAADGHTVSGRHIIPDSPAELERLLDSVTSAHVTIITGGTGLSSRDTTYHTLARRYDSPIPGFGELFRMLSFEEIGAAAMLSRASAGRMGDMIVFSLPGSVNAVRLATERLILPELGHMVRELSR